MPGWEYCRGDNDLQGRGWDNYDTRELYITLEYSWNTWSCQRGINIESSSTVEAMLCGITRYVQREDFVLEPGMYIKYFLGGRELKPSQRRVQTRFHGGEVVLVKVFNEQRKEMVYNGMDWEVKAEYLRAHNR